MARVHIADRDVEGLAKVSYKESAKYKRKPTAWHAPWPPRPEPKAANVETEPDDLLLRATIAAAMRKGNAP